MEIVNTIISSLTLIAIVIGLLVIKYSKKQIQFNTVEKCIDDHRNILRKQQRYCIKRKNDTEHLVLLRDHLGLVTEELFYMRENYLPKGLALQWLRHMIEFIPIQTTCSGGDNPILNRKQIIESKEISCYINAPSDKPKTSQSVKKKKRLEQYLKTATNKAAFTQINKVFTLSQQQAESLSYDNQDNLTFEDKETVRKLVNFIWDNNTKAPTKRLRKKLSIIKATYK